MLPLMSTDTHQTVLAPKRRETWHDAYDTQMALWRWTRSPNGIDWLTENYRVTTKDIARESSKDLLKQLYAAENSKLFQSDPFYVSSEMCEVVDAAKTSFEPEPLLPTDLLSAFGFLYFEKPFQVRDRFDSPMTIAAISWAPIISESNKEAFKGSDNVLATLQQRDYTEIWSKEEEKPESVDGIALTIYSQTRFDSVDDDVRDHLKSIGAPSLVPTHLTPWWFGMTFEGNEVDLQGNPTGAGWWWRISQTTFRLMQQQLSTRYNMRPDKQTRNEAKRRGFDEREIVVVRLRREKGKGNDETRQDANYSHRFIVSGHWRNQFYRGSNVHRQIWISPYVKGPESLPLVVRPRRVYTWTR